MPRQLTQREQEEAVFFQLLADAEAPGGVPLGEELLVYADWLEERTDPAAALVRHHYYMLQLSPANSILPSYVREEARLRAACDRKWWQKYEAALGRHGALRFWKRLYSRKSICLPENQHIQIPTDLSHQLQNGEDHLALRFPRSYRTFLQVFGIAELGDFFRVLGPDASPAWDIREANRVLRTSQAWTESYSPQRLKELVLFSHSTAGDQVFWDTASPTKLGEYKIVIQSRSEPQGQLQHLTDSFRGFVRSICLGTGFLRIAVGVWRGARPPQTISPHWRSTKE